MVNQAVVAKFIVLQDARFDQRMNAASELLLYNGHEHVVCSGERVDLQTSISRATSVQAACYASPSTFHIEDHRHFRDGYHDDDGVTKKTSTRTRMITLTTTITTPSFCPAFRGKSERRTRTNIQTQKKARGYLFGFQFLIFCHYFLFITKLN